MYKNGTRRPAETVLSRGKGKGGEGSRKSDCGME
jgi:hypothetical protein